PLPVMAFFKRDAAHDVQLRNLLQRKGFENLEAVLEAGLEAGRVDGMALSVVTVLEGRNLDVPDEVRERILTCKDADVLRRWLTRAGNVATAEEIFREPT
ncbi:MAG: Uma2 family endonuclease, partial [bacterium]|nr:Uma2 family endonuclease [bacterium]